MSDAPVSQRELEGVLRRLRALEVRLGRTEVRESPQYATDVYTPTYRGSTTAGVTTYATQEGAWTRIGNIIIAWGTVVWTAATGTGAALISLPFVASASSFNNVAAYVRTTNVTFANGSVQCQIAAGTSSILMISPATNAAGTNIAVEAAGNIIFTAIYPVDV